MARYLLIKVEGKPDELINYIKEDNVIIEDSEVNDEPDDIGEPTIYWP